MADGPELSEAFLRALQEDFQQHGKRAIEELREKNTERYLALIAALVRKPGGSGPGGRRDDSIPWEPIEIVHNFIEPPPRD